MRASELMSTPVVTVFPEASLKEVIERMAAEGVSGMPVVDHLGHLVGIISESDLLSKLEHEEKARGLLGLLDLLSHAVGADHRLHARTAAELMTSRVVSAGPDASVRELTHQMTAHDINRLPIVEGGRLVGIVTRADILRTVARSDTAIAEEVRWRLVHDLWIDTAGLEITARNGIVTLSGEVGTRSEADLVKHWTAATDGVIDVEAGALRCRVDDRRAETPAGLRW